MKLSQMALDSSCFELLDSSVSTMTPSQVLAAYVFRTDDSLFESYNERHANHYRHQDKYFHIYYNDGVRNQVYFPSSFDGQLYIWPTHILPIQWRNLDKGHEMSYKNKEKFLYDVGQRNGHLAYEHFKSIFDILDEPGNFDEQTTIND